LNEITHVQGSGNYVIIHTLNQKLLVLNTMKRIVELLMPYQFVRVHKSFIVSFQHIDSIEANAVIVNGISIPISDTMKDQFQEFLANHSTQI
jgi:DNA-binding LytR/AlgR family response regulator